jgi:hypothetical protein
MMRAWIGVALLAVSWLLGMTYYFPANRIAWVVMVAGGTVLLSGVITRAPRPREAGIALLLLLPAVWFASWPLRAAPLLIVAGLAVELLPIPRRWPGWLGRGAVAAGAVMLAQSLALAAYAAWTARCHELPRPLPELLAGVARLLGIEAAADGSDVVMHSIRQMHRLGATWELLLDPATLCFFVGALVVLGLVVWGRLPHGRRLSGWVAAVGILTLVVVLWLPVRAGLLMALYLHRVLRSDYELPLHVMNQFLSPWVLLFLLLAPVLLAWRFVGLPIGDAAEATQAEGQPPAAQARPWYYPAAAGLLLLAAAVFTAAVEWDPVGTPHPVGGGSQISHRAAGGFGIRTHPPPPAGRVMVVERHSTWEPTTRPYDTKWFGHDSGYNYAAVYDYLSQFFEMSPLLQSQKIDNATLAKCDVLVIKTPTARYGRDEVEAVVRFVERGGGLLLIGDHTNVFNSGTYLNDIVRHFGFTFRHDLLFGTGESPYDQLYRKSRVPHPIVQHQPPTDFAVSCSIDPGRSWGRAVIRETGLWSLPPEYHIENYHPFPQHRPEMRYGAFIQLWSTRYGKGRVLAFGDSTIFSNFCAFQPGKAELLRGMIDWLNHGNLGDPCPWLLPIGILPLALGLWAARARYSAFSTQHSASSTQHSASSMWLVLLAAGTCGWVVAGASVAALGRWAMPIPEAKAAGPKPCVVIDRTTSQVPLSKGAFTRGEGKGYGLFEQWISRVAVPWRESDRNLYTTRRGQRSVGVVDPEAFSRDALVVICPSRSVSREFREGLVQYVSRGGRLLVIDSPENTASTANSLLWPFGLSVYHEQIPPGQPDAPHQLMLTDDWPGIEIPRACQITGGRPIAHLGTTPVGAVTGYEKGTVMAIGFGSVFSDERFGQAWSVQPDANMLFTYDTYVRYNVQFALLRALMTGQEVTKFFSGRVVIDRTVSEVTLPEPGTAPSDDQGFGLAEIWPRYLGYSTVRQGTAPQEGSPLRTSGRRSTEVVAGAEAFSGDLLVIFHPSRELSGDYRDRLIRYVAAGGKLLVVDSPQNTNSTANDVLKPFKLAVDRDQPRRGTLALPNEDGELWAQVAIDTAWKLSGGQPFAALDLQTPIGTTTRFGKGAVTVVGFGSLWNNASMRGSWDLPPPAKSLLPYDVLTAVLRALMTEQPFVKSLPTRSN